MDDQLHQHQVIGEAPPTTAVSTEPLLHFVDQASEQQVEVQTAAVPQDDAAMLQLQDFT